MSHPVVEVVGVSYGYGAETVLQDVSLTVERGEFLGLVGPNGSGKTTLLRLMLNLMPLRSGQVRLFGQPLSQFRSWFRVGYVPQKAASFNTGFPATVREVVLTGRTARLGLFRRIGRADRQAAERAMELVGIGALANRPIGQLSGGQQQRAFIARALASEPELLILDEPTVGVDPAAQEQFYALLRRLRQEMNISIVLVSHDIGVVTNEVTRLACLNRRIHFHGPPAEFNPDRLSEFYGHKVSLVSHHHH